MPNRHSGFVVVTCADWAYHVHHWLRIHANEPGQLKALSQELNLPYRDLKWEADQLSPTSRLADLVELAVRHPGNVHGILPHILRVQAPSLVVGDPLLRAAFIMLNAAVLEGAEEIWIDGHSACAGIVSRYPQERGQDQFNRQRGLMLGGAQDFANQLAINSHRPVLVHLTYTQFERPGEVLQIHDVATVRSTVPM